MIRKAGAKIPAQNLEESTIKALKLFSSKQRSSARERGIRNAPCRWDKPGGQTGLGDGIGGNFGVSVRSSTVVATVKFDDFFLELIQDNSRESHTYSNVRSVYVRRCSAGRLEESIGRVIEDLINRS